MVRKITLVSSSEKHSSRRIQRTGSNEMAQQIEELAAQAKIWVQFPELIEMWKARTDFQVVLGPPHDTDTHTHPERERSKQL